MLSSDTLGPELNPDPDPVCANSLRICTWLCITAEAHIRATTTFTCVKCSYSPLQAETVRPCMLDSEPQSITNLHRGAMPSNEPKMNKKSPAIAIRAIATAGTNPSSSSHDDVPRRNAHRSFNNVALPFEGSSVAPPANQCVIKPRHRIRAH